MFIPGIVYLFKFAKNLFQRINFNSDTHSRIFLFKVSELDKQMILCSTRDVTKPLCPTSFVCLFVRSFVRFLVKIEKKTTLVEYICKSNFLYIYWVFSNKCNDPFINVTAELEEITIYCFNDISNVVVFIYPITVSCCFNHCW